MATKNTVEESLATQLSTIKIFYISLLSDCHVLSINCNVKSAVEIMSCRVSWFQG